MKKCVSVRLIVLVLLIVRFVFGDVNELGRCNGLLIGMFVRFVVSLLVEFCGMMCS